MDALLFPLQTPTAGDTDGWAVFHRDSSIIGGEGAVSENPLLALNLRDL